MESQALQKALKFSQNCLLQEFFGHSQILGRLYLNANWTREKKYQY